MSLVLQINAICGIYPVGTFLPSRGVAGPRSRSRSPDASSAGRARSCCHLDGSVAVAANIRYVLACRGLRLLREIAVARSAAGGRAVLGCPQWNEADAGARRVDVLAEHCGLVHVVGRAGVHTRVEVGHAQREELLARRVPVAVHLERLLPQYCEETGRLASEGIRRRRGKS